MRRAPSTVAVLAAVAVIIVPVSDAGTATWAQQANRVCTMWAAKAKKVLGNRQVKTAAQAYSYSVTAAAFEKQQLAALKKIDKPTVAGKKALRMAQTDITEIQTAIADWKAGKRSAFTKVFVKWASDSRANKAFAAAGATDCG